MLYLYLGLILFLLIVAYFLYNYDETLMRFPHAKEKLPKPEEVVGAIKQTGRDVREAPKRTGEVFGEMLPGHSKDEPGRRTNPYDDPA
jgi:type II secretory pathway component PulM